MRAEYVGVISVTASIVRIILSRGIGIDLARGVDVLTRSARFVFGKW